MKSSGRNVQLWSVLFIRVPLSPFGIQTSPSIAFDKLIELSFSIADRRVTLGDETRNDATSAETLRGRDTNQRTRLRCPRTDTYSRLKQYFDEVTVLLWSRSLYGFTAFPRRSFTPQWTRSMRSFSLTLLLFVSRPILHLHSNAVHRTASCFSSDSSFPASRFPLLVDAFVEERGSFSRTGQTGRGTAFTKSRARLTKR